VRLIHPFDPDRAPDLEIGNLLPVTEKPHTRLQLDEGIARAVAWFREHRAAHPEEDVPVTADHEGASREAGQVWKTATAP